MRFSCCQSALQLLFAVVALLVPLTSYADLVTRTDGRTQNGTVIGVKGKNLLIKVGAGQIGIPLRQIKAIDMEVPAKFGQARKALDAKDYENALAALTPVVNNFKGLPLDWAKEAMQMRGDIYMGLNDLDKAKEAFLEFQKLYPGEKTSGGGAADISMAKLAVAGKKYDEAKETLVPLAEKALQAESFTQSEGESYGQVFVLLGDIDAAEERYSEALENYLRTVTIFYHDDAVAVEARQKADQLRETHGVHVP